MGISNLSQIERGIQVPDKVTAIKIAQRSRETNETIEEALLKTFDRVDYDYLFRNRIAEVRTFQEKSQAELAADAGPDIDEDVLMDLENGIRAPTAQEKKQILKALNKTYQEIFTRYGQNADHQGQ
ncbi:helix-turn-helix transcriptional regulator [Candidatus Poribacteria bacterium]|nr:helix-turn-helix transcriptional regulator [Candidatus Poribacteria bacterium]